jgi:hypothetical protein
MVGSKVIIQINSIIQLTVLGDPSKQPIKSGAWFQKGIQLN